MKRLPDICARNPKGGCSYTCTRASMLFGRSNHEPFLISDAELHHAIALRL